MQKGIEVRIDNGLFLKWASERKGMFEKLAFLTRQYPDKPIASILASVFDPEKTEPPSYSVYIHDHVKINNKLFLQWGSEHEAEFEELAELLHKYHDEPIMNLLAEMFEPMPELSQDEYDIG